MPAVLAPPTLIMPGDPGWDEARRAWNLAVDQHPAAVALPASAQDVADVIRFAGQYRLRVAAQGTGHNAAPLGSLADTILVKTERMRRVTIDPAARSPRCPLPCAASPSSSSTSSTWAAPAEADALLAPLRALDPVTDTIGMIPAQALSHLHMDPEQPSAGAGDGLMLASLPAEAIETLIRVAGTGTRLAVIELRHIGGEMKRARPANGALAAVDADYALFAGGHGALPAGSRGGGLERRRRPDRHAALGGAADVSQPRGNPPRPRHLLDPAGLRPAPPHQGRGRPR